jgi:hypothetical protein
MRCRRPGCGVQIVKAVSGAYCSDSCRVLDYKSDKTLQAKRVLELLRVPEVPPSERALTAALATAVIMDIHRRPSAHSASSTSASASIRASAGVIVHPSACCISVWPMCTAALSSPILTRSTRINVGANVSSTPPSL